jgi:predicted acetyltransferase
VTLEYRTLAEADLEAMLDVRERAFGPMSSDGAQRWFAVNRELVDEGRLGGVFDGGALAGCGKARGFVQAWHGRPVPMAGMSGITVLPEYRGRGVGPVIMRQLADLARRRGEPISALYPATVPLYRHLGWELVGAQSRYALPAHHLRLLGGRLPVRRLGEGDAEAAQVMVAEAVGVDRASGPLVWSTAQWRRVLSDPSRFAYACEGGLVVYGWEGPDLSVDRLWAGTAVAARTLWSLVGSGSSVAKTVLAYLGPDDPLFWLLPEEAGHEVVRHGWMLRVLDVPSALEARGYPEELDVELSFTVEDREHADHSGRWVMRVEGGRAQVARAGADGGGGLVMGAHGLAGLYAGRPAVMLERAGLLDGGSSQQGWVADAVFATPVPYLTDYF